MIPSNPGRNKIIYDLWLKSLTVDQIASRTDIPKGTVGYYVRKFNKLASQGKPIVFPRESKNKLEPRSSFLSQMLKMETGKTTLSVLNKIVEMWHQQKHEALYYYLMNLKLISELDTFLTPQTIQKLGQLMRKEIHKMVSTFEEP